MLTDICQFYQGWDFFWGTFNPSMKPQSLALSFWDHVLEHLPSLGPAHKESSDHLLQVCFLSLVRLDISKAKFLVFSQRSDKKLVRLWLSCMLCHITGWTRQHLFTSRLSSLSFQLPFFQVILSLYKWPCIYFTAH